jgi:hypothetical protein
MKLVSKNPDYSKPSFWVENYTEAEKQLFLGLGFTEKLSNVPIAFRGKNGDVNGDTLEFKGSSMFGMFSSEEYDRFFDAITKFTRRKTITINAMNPYD